MRRRLLEKGCRVDALTGDGVLAQPGEMLRAEESFEDTLRELEEAVAKETGYKVQLLLVNYLPLLTTIF